MKAKRRQSRGDWLTEGEHTQRWVQEGKLKGVGLRGPLGLYSGHHEDPGKGGLGGQKDEPAEIHEWVSQGGENTQKSRPTSLRPHEGNVGEKWRKPVEGKDLRSRNSKPSHWLDVGGGQRLRPHPGAQLPGSQTLVDSHTKCPRACQVQESDPYKYSRSVLTHQLSPAHNKYKSGGRSV